MMLISGIVPVLSAVRLYDLLNGLEHVFVNGLFHPSDVLDDVIGIG